MNKSICVFYGKFLSMLIKWNYAKLIWSLICVNMQVNTSFEHPWSENWKTGSHTLALKDHMVIWAYVMAQKLVNLNFIHCMC